MKAEFLGETWDVIVRYHCRRLTVSVDWRELTIRDFREASDGCASWDEVDSYVRSAIADAAVEIRRSRAARYRSLIAA